MKKVSIVGFGRFGQVLYRLLKDDFIITIFSRHKIDSSLVGSPRTIITHDVKKIYKSEAIFFCVPIFSFEEVIKEHKKYFQRHNLLIDVLSVKIHPAKIFKKHLKDSPVQAMLTHPMFGPDSSKWGFEGLPLIIDQFKADQVNYNFWKNYFKSKKLRIIEMSANEHDRLAVNSQGLTHFIGRLLEAYGFEPSPIDSLGTKKLLGVKEQTCNDTWQLFTNLQHFNPHTKKMRVKLGEIYDQLYNKLLPKQRDSRYITFGIQGGKGSFNEQALLYFTKRANIGKYKINYLYTSDRVLSALYTGKIDRGQIAIHNSVGGIVDESITALAKYKCKIIEQFAIKISHALIIRKDADFSEITTIITHPQVLAQCKNTLSQKYSHLTKISGKKKLIDQTLVAKLLSEKKLPKSVATLGSKILAQIYNLKVIEEDLQDDRENYTSFLQICRI